MMLFALCLLALYSPPIQAGTCGATIRTPTGQIQSNNYPRNYPDGSDCTWRIEPINAVNIKIAFESTFEIEQAAGCGYDFVQLYGVSNRGAASIGKYCGTNSPGYKVVGSNKALVKFISDGSVNGKGFSFRFTAVINGGWNNWSNYNNDGECSTTCGSGMQRKISTRSCSNPSPLGGGTNCSGIAIQRRTVPCNIAECPVNGNWSQWSDFMPGNCSVSCGSGFQIETQRRKCTNPPPAYGGENCTGIDERTRTTICMMDPCPVNGNWSQWSDFMPGSCSVSCESGFKIETQTRDCTNPSPAYGGENCTGIDERTRTTSCLMRPCPINGGWGDWTSWTKNGDCSVTCGAGMVVEKRNRTCNNPSPMNGGYACSGQLEEGRTVECSEDSCQGMCSMDGIKLAYIPDFTKYYACVNNQPILKSCQNGYRWDESTSDCVKICPTFTAQLLPYPSDCYKYVQCFWGFSIVMHCAKGTAWSTTHQVCIHTSDANCSY